MTSVQAPMQMVQVPNFPSGKIVQGAPGTMANVGILAI